MIIDITPEELQIILDALEAYSVSASYDDTEAYRIHVMLEAAQSASTALRELVRLNLGP